MAKPPIQECKQEVVVTDSWLINVLEESQRWMKTLKISVVELADPLGCNPEPCPRRGPGRVWKRTSCEEHF